MASSLDSPDALAAFRAAMGLKEPVSSSQHLKPVEQSKNSSSLDSSMADSARKALPKEGEVDTTPEAKGLTTEHSESNLFVEPLVTRPSEDSLKNEGEVATPPEAKLSTGTATSSKSSNYSKLIARDLIERTDIIKCLNCGHEMNQTLTLSKRCSH